MATESAPSHSATMPEQQALAPVVIDKADLEDLIGSVAWREIASKLQGAPSTPSSGGEWFFWGNLLVLSPSSPIWLGASRLFLPTPLLDGC